MLRLIDPGNKGSRQGSALALLLAFVLLASTIHVSLHDWDDSGSGPVGHQECQLSKLPGALLPTPPLPVLFFNLASLVIFVTQSPSWPVDSWSWQARAPPL
ncbi:MAG: hypothetical protein KUG71_05890 [Porticoccaceae bacterium]|nr:hypothetical protein [Porticoccaceae bacterium]